MSEKSASVQDVRKVYITDSPVVDEAIEYEYVNSDIEEELDSGLIPVKDRIKTPAPPRKPKTPTKSPEASAEEMPPQPDLSEVDELAKEAEYQRELQERLQKATLNDTSSPSARPGDDETDKPEHTADNDANEPYSDSELLEWKNPPSNPFANQAKEPPASQAPDINRYEDMNSTEQSEEKFVPQNFEKAQQQTGVSPQQQSNHTVQSLPPGRPHPPQTNNSPQHQYNPPQQQYNPSTSLHNQQSSPPQQTYNQQSNMTYQQQLQPQQQTMYPHHQHQYNQQEQFQQYTNQYAGVYEQQQDPYLLQQQQAEMERVQLQQLHQQRLFAQQQLLQQKLAQQQYVEQQLLLQQQQQQQQQQLAPEGLMLQRNVPVMYMQNPTNQNEYYAVTPKEAYHPYSSQYEQFEETVNQAYDGDIVSESSVEAEGRVVKAIVAPKPARPVKNFLEKNKGKVQGQHSAKPGYSQRLVQKRVEQEQMKEWAPGMVVPRKKAASADDIIRGSERDEAMSAEDVWSKRARDLAQAKQNKLSGGIKGKKPNSKPSLKRFPSDNSLSKKNRVPPIAQQREPKGYLTSYQAAQGWTEDPRMHVEAGVPLQHVNGQMSPTRISPNGPYYNKNQTATGYASMGYQSNIPHHPPVNQYPVNSSPSYAQQYSPTYGGGGYSPQYQGYDSQYQGGSGPNSGGYHHNPRQEDLMRQQQVDYHNPHPPALEQHRNSYAAVQNHQTSYRPTQGPPNHQPSYDYSGYHNSVGYRDQHNHERDAKPYEGSPYSSPHPPYSGNTDNSTSKKGALNPYAAVPPIHHKPGKQPAQNAVMSNGSYMDAYQKDKEKAEKLNKPPTYKVYTMKDYKKLKLEYKLGGLGLSQDPEVLKEKNEQRLKQLQYAKEAMEAEKKKPHPSPRRASQDEVQTISGRQLAVEYAKHIPKPKVLVPHPHQKQTSPTSSYAATLQPNHGKIPALKPVTTDIGESPSATKQPAIQPLSELDLDLDYLQSRHDEDRRLAEEIQYKMQQTA